jgi:hypothetical protein
MNLPIEVKKQIKKVDYFLKTYGWKLDENGNRYKDVKGMQRKLDYVNWRLNSERSRGFPFTNYKETMNLHSQKMDLEYALGLREFKIMLPISYKIVKECSSHIAISVDEFNQLTGGSNLSIFQELEERYVGTRPNYLLESFSVMDFTY